MQGFVSVLVAALVVSLWLVVLHGALGGGVGCADLHISFSSSPGHSLGYFQGLDVAPSVCHFSNDAGINCGKGLLFLHYLSLKEHMKKLKSLSNACRPVDMSVPFWVRTMVCAAQALEVSL